MISAARSSGGGLDELAIPRLQEIHTEQCTNGALGMRSTKKLAINVRSEDPGDSRDGLRPNSGGCRAASQLRSTQDNAEIDTGCPEGGDGDPGGHG